MVFSYITQVLYINSKNHENFTYLIAPEQFVTNQLVFYFQRSHFLAEKFSEKIDSFREAGLIEKIMSKYVDQKFLKSKHTPDPHISLNLSHLFAIFALWLCGLLVSIVTVMIELFLFRKRKVTPTKPKVHEWVS